MIEISNISLTEADSPTEPVSLEEAKEKCRASDIDDFDDEFERLIVTAREQVELFTNRALVEKEISLNAETPDDSFTSVVTTYKLKLPYTKGAAISELTLSDWEETELVIEDDYEVKGNTIYWLSGWYAITYTVTPTVPAALKEAILMQIVHLFTHKGDEEKQGLSKEVEDLAQPFVEIWL